MTIFIEKENNTKIQREQNYWILLKNRTYFMKNHLIVPYLKFLKEGQVMLYPTDTIWGIGCSAVSEEAISKIFMLKRRSLEKSMIILVNNIEMIQNYTRFNLAPIKERVLEMETPTTFIIPQVFNLSPSLIKEDGTIAFRIPKHEFCIELLNQLCAPIISTSANISGGATPRTLQEINIEIKKGVDFIVDDSFDTSNFHTPSAIIKFDESYKETKIR